MLFLLNSIQCTACFSAKFNEALNQSNIHIAHHKMLNQLFFCNCIQFLFGRKQNYFAHSPLVIYAHPLLTIDWKKFWYSDGSRKCVKILENAFGQYLDFM